MKTLPVAVSKSAQPLHVMPTDRNNMEELEDVPEFDIWYLTGEY